MAIDPANTDAVAIPQLPDLILSAQSLLVGANGDGKMGKFNPEYLAEIIAPFVAAIGGSGFVAVADTVLPDLGDVASAFTIIGAQTSTQTTGGNIITTEPLNVLGWSGNTGQWTLLTEIPIPLKINKWINGNFVAGSQVLFGGQLWDASVDIVTGEFPNVSNKWKPLIPTAYTNRAVGYNSTFASSSTDWAIGVGAPVFNTNTSISGKMSLTFSGSGGESVALPTVMTVGKYYKVSLKAALVSGTAVMLRVGNYTTTSGAFKIDIIPTSTETEFSFIIKAAAVNFNIGVLAANNNGSGYSIDDVNIFELSELEVKQLDLSDIKTFGAVGNGLIDDLPAVNSAITYLSENGFTERLVKFKNGTFKLTNLVNINGFESLYLTGENSTIKVAISGAVNRHLLSVNTGGNVFVNGLKIDVNNDLLMLQAIRLYTLTGTVSVINTNVYNFNNVNQRGIYMESVTKSPSLAISNYIPSPLVQNCKFWNPQVVAITAYNYTTSTLKGCGIELGTAAEYVQIIGCNFYGLSTGISSLNGANSTISTCVFEQCDPTQVASDNGIINVPTTAGNQGKLTISNCRFAHNYGYCFVSKYASTGRGNILIGNHFIVNSWTPILINSGGNNLITGNIFNRNNEQQILTGFPFSAGLGVGVELVSSSRNSIRGNYFNDGMKYAVSSTGTSNKNAVCNNEHYLLTTGFSSLVGANNIVTDNNDLA